MQAAPSPVVESHGQDRTGDPGASVAPGDAAGPSRSGKPLLELHGITKGFGGIQALGGVDFSVLPGEVHVLLGENGAGKSTLIKIIAGVYQRDGGEYLVGGEPVGATTPARMRQLGISVIYQELSLIRQMDVASNVFLGRERMVEMFGARLPGLIDRAGMRRACGALFRDLEIPIDPGRLVADLSIAEMQLVEIARAVAFNARLILMDEPTTSIGIPEKKRLFELVAALKRRGIGIVFVSHILEDCLALGDRITVIRDGTYIDTLPVESADVDTLVRLMTGRTLSERYPRIESRVGDRVLEVRGLTRVGRFEDVSFDLHAGEILAFAGLVGAGRTDVMHALYGLDPADDGTIEIAGHRVRITSTRRAIRAGISLLTEDRKNLGILPKMSVRENIVVTLISVSLGVISKSLLRLRQLLHFPAMRELSNAMVRDMRIKTASIETPITLLSGGNQQKVLLARALSTHAKIVILDEPTKGVDAGAKIEIYRMLEALVERRIAILVVSSELPEVLALAHRIVVMKQGRVTAVLDRDATSDEEIMKFATT